MKTKFEDNVASKDAQPSGSAEPALPWRVTDEDAAPADGKEAQCNAAQAGAPLLKVSAGLIVLLILTMFAFIANTITNVSIDKYEAESAAMQKEEAVSALTASLKKTMVEKKALNDNASQLERRVGELSAQKELYTTVIETLTKKADEEIQASSVAPAADKK